jgi:thiamine-phosphate pyrophosphorylase
VDRVGYSQGARLVVDSALRAARELGARHVGTEHLLVALLEAGGTEVTQALSRAGLRPTSLRLQILRQMGASAGRLEDARLYVLLTAGLASAPLFKAAQALIAGGADVIQYREKELADGPFLANALTLRAMTREASVLLIINDRADVALLVAADGVHLGQMDLPPAEARRLLGPTRIVGVSTHNEREAKLALAERPDYVAAGSIFPTATKEAEVGGLAYLSLLLGTVKPDCPVYPIGGITLGNLEEVLAAGADRVAVSTAIIGAPDIRSACAEFKSHLPAGGT